MYNKQKGTKNMLSSNTKINGLICCHRKINSSRRSKTELISVKTKDSSASCQKQITDINNSGGGSSSMSSSSSSMGCYTDIYPVTTSFDQYVTYITNHFLKHCLQCHGWDVGNDVGYICICWSNQTGWGLWVTVMQCYRKKTGGAKRWQVSFQKEYVS